MKKFKSAIENTKILKISAISLFIFFLLTFFTGITACKNNSQTAASQSNEATVSVTESVPTGSTVSSTANGTTAFATTATTEEAVPGEIQGLITGAGNYFKDGEYSLAEKSYRDAELAINNSKLSAEKKKELLDGFSANYSKAKDIVNTAKLHFGNGMQLEYEKRFDEAKKEFEASLTAYPKYKEAIDALAALEEMMGLK
jgi:tetratricopeptide (TPR) repeat protein